MPLLYFHHITILMLLILIYYLTSFFQTEGFGPLFFGALMSLFENSTQPGAPFVLASVLSIWAFLHCFELPAEADMYTLKLDAYRHGREEGVGLMQYNDTDLDDTSVSSY